MPRVSVRAVRLRVLWPAGGLCLAILLGRVPFSRGQESPSHKTATEQKQATPIPSSAQDESEALGEALQSSAGSPQALIKKLENFLALFPQTPRREQVLRTIFRQALQTNDPQKAATYAEKLLELEPTDPEVLATLVDLSDRQSDPSSRERALQYATRFILRAEKLTQEARPAAVPGEKWQETQAQMRAIGFLMRGKIYAKSGDAEKAFADFEKSYAAYPTSQVAERLGDLASKKGETDRAIDYYATAFAFPDQDADAAHRDQLRKKLGSAYLAEHQSQTGLGDLVLARYDELIHTLNSRYAAKRLPNADARDPFDYVLQRLDGSEVRLGEYRGKVVVLDFWATWCGPCRLGGRLFERVIETFRADPAAVFLAVNVDENRDGVLGFTQEEKWTVPVVYAQGLDHLLRVGGLPTLVIFDREGRVAFRQEGFDPGSFVGTLEKKVREVLGPANAPSAPAGSPR